MNATYRIERLPERSLCVLHVAGSLQLDPGSFRQACSQLLEAPHNRLVLDITGLTYLDSVFLGSIQDLHANAQSRAKSLTILLLPKIQKPFIEAGLDHVLKFQVLPED